MPASRNALLRYKTIDNCLRNRYRLWTIEDLVDACSDALYEYEGIRKGISLRTVQSDLQVMRSDKLGYNAPIIVKDKKYYTYEDPHYSITDTPLTEHDVKVMGEAVELLKQMHGFSNFTGMEDIVSRLDDHVTAVRHHSKPVILMESNERLRGLKFLDIIHQAIIHQQVLKVNYKSFKAKSAHTFNFSPYILKEYRNRWFVFGRREGVKMLLNLALDRIKSIALDLESNYIIDDTFDAETFFDDIVGVTKGPTEQPELIRLQANAEHAPYIKTKPIHRSQHIEQENEDGSMIFTLNVVVNQELIREIISYADGLTVLAPHHLVCIVKKRLRKASENYTKED